MMEFCNLVEQLKAHYTEDMTIAKNGAILLSPRKSIPIAKHIIFAPMDKPTMEYLLESYKLPFPKDLLEIYKTANGMKLFLKRVVYHSNISEETHFFCDAGLSIYGIPLSLRIPDRPEPFNISIEDLNRLPGTPNNYLKFGSFVLRQGELKKEYDLFVDVECGKTCTVPRTGETAVIQETWESIDSCLCDLYHRLAEQDAGEEASEE